MSSTRKLHHRVLHLSWMLFAGGVILIALALAVARMLLPAITDYRADIEQLLSAQLGRTVHVDRVQGAWRGLHPEIKLSNISVLDRDGKRTWLQLGQVRASLDVFDSLANWRLDVGHLDVVGLKVDVERHADGSYSVGGTPSLRDGNDARERQKLLDWLVAREQIRIERSDIRWKDARLSREPLHFDGVDLSMDNIGGTYRFDGTAQLANQGGRRLAFILDIGVAGRAAHLRNRIYLEGSLQLGPWLDGTIWSHTAVNDGELNFKLWAQGGTRAQRVVADVDIRHLRWRHAMVTRDNDEPPTVSSFGLQRLSTRLFWQRNTHGWQANLRRLRVGRDGKQWPVSNAQLRYGRSNDGAERRIEGRVGFVRIQDLRTALLSIAGVDQRSRSMLAGLAPRGDVRDLVFRVDSRAGRATKAYLAAKFADLGIDTWEGLPGASGLDGELVMDQDHGFARLDSHAATATVSSLFNQPLAADQLSGDIYWRRQADDWRVSGVSMQVRNADIHAHGKFVLDVPRNDASPFLDLQASYADGDAASARRYLPRKILPPKVTEWLDRSLVGGKIPSGQLMFFGRLSDFPFDHGEGVFETRFGLEDGSLDYQPGWPRAKHLAAEITFRDRSMFAQVESGRMLGLDVKASSVTIADLSDQGTVAIAARAAGPAGDMLRLLAADAHTRAHAETLSRVTARGAATAVVDIAIPLTHEPNRVSGRVRFAGAGFKTADPRASLSDIHGRLGFKADDNRILVTAKALRVKYLGRPAIIDISSNPTASGGNVQLRLQTRMAPQLLLAAHGGAIDGFVNGQTDWTVKLGMEYAAGSPSYAIDLNVESQMQGVDINLPGNWRKPAAQKRTFELTTRFSPAGMAPVRIQYGRLAQALLQIDSGTFQRGELRLGGGSAQLPAQAGLYVAGHVPDFSLSHWELWYRALKSHDRAPAVAAPAILGADIKIDRLELFDHEFHDAQLHVERAPNSWQAQVESREVAGKITIPVQFDSSTPLVMDLAYLRLVSPTHEHPELIPSPRELPSLQITSKVFSYDRRAFGQLNLRARRFPDGLRFEQVRLHSPYLEVDAAGSWTSIRGQEASQFFIKVNSKNVGDALRRMGYDGTFDSGQGVGQIDAEWQGPPSAFNLAHVNGNLTLTIRKGRLLNVDPGGGRVFGLLSLQALPRRLSLDFSDLFGRGFAFDRIAGHFAVSDGDAYTNDLYMSGPAARVEVSGRVGLAARDYDESVVVTPKLTSSLPLVGGLAGGPGVGLGLWVAQRVLGNKIDQLSRSYYTVTGSWDAPKVERTDEP